jgi:hypothetical protein
MHLYTAENENRVRILGIIGAVATVASIGVGGLFHAADLTLPAWLGPPGALGLFSGLFWLYNRYLWRWQVGGIRMSAIPVLTGSWLGEIEIEGGSESVRLPCLVQLSQTWLQMSVRFHTRASSSVSFSATVRGEGTAFGDFRYEYRVEPRTGHVVQGMTSHDGVARLRRTSPDWSAMQGDFFNDAAFQRYGSYELRHQAKPMSTDAWLHQEA